MKVYKDMREWWHPEIDYHEMIDKFKWTHDRMKDILEQEYTFPVGNVNLMMHANAWDEDGKDNKNQLFQFWNKQLLDSIADEIRQLKPKTVLDVCAGDGMLAKALHNRGLPIIASDNYSWPFEKRHFKIHKLDHKKALEKFQPDIVIGCWMPLHTDWTPDFRKTKSVKHYIQIGEVEACCGGNWDDRKKWPIYRLDASEYALCRTDSIWNYRDEYGMHHSSVYLTSRNENKK